MTIVYFVCYIICASSDYLTEPVREWLYLTLFSGQPGVRLRRLDLGQRSSRSRRSRSVNRCKAYMLIKKQTRSSTRIVREHFRLIVWLIDCMIDRLIDWLTDWTIYRSIYQSIDRSIISFIITLLILIFN